MNGPKDRTLQAAVIGAAGAVVAALVGLLAGSNGVADDLIPGARPQETVRTTATETTVSTVTATQDAAGSISSATVLHAGSITLVKNSGGADLDAPASDGTWGTLDAKTLTEVTFFGDTMGLRMKYLPTQDSDVRRCESSTGYRSYDNDISVTALRPGDSYCVLTDKARFSLITITAIAEDESISFTAVTLKRAEEVRE